jgi:hypothetical protein
VKDTWYLRLVKSIILILVAGCLLFWFLPLHVNYYYDGDRIFCVHDGLESWSRANIDFKRTFDKKDADVLIDHIPQSQCDSITEVAEHNSGKIHINADYQTTDKQLTGVIAHEFGHYLGLHHNHDNSVMNIDIPYGILPTDLDIARVRFEILKLKLDRL